MAESAYLSGESDFYGNYQFPLALQRWVKKSGDETIRNGFEVRAVNLDVEEWWAGKKPSLIELSWENLDAKSGQVAAKLYNPYAGQVCGRQLDEIVEEFVRRLPPATTQVTTKIPWIFIANPFYKISQTEKGGRTLSREEALSKDDIKWAQFVREGKKLLGKLVALRHDFERKHVGMLSKTTVTKALNAETKEVVKKPLNTAIELGSSNDLGSAAKVAPDDGQARTARLICIYTRNFDDRTDVKRILHRLKDLGFVEKGERVYYKCDAYTYLELKYSNNYNIAASMYSSDEILDMKLGLKDRKLKDFFHKPKKQTGDYRHIDSE
ncbi:DNA polymerase II large subunit-like protein [Diplocarpon rosae]|nr:DNA polymerase II large subunit-like protein [Diplocarpon rosae]